MDSAAYYSLEASQFIQVDTFIGTDNILILNAGDSTTLQTGFSMGDSTVLEIQTEGCESQ